MVKPYKEVVFVDPEQPKGTIQNARGLFEDDNGQVKNPSRGVVTAIGDEVKGVVVGDVVITSGDWDILNVNINGKAQFYVPVDNILAIETI